MDKYQNQLTLREEAERRLKIFESDERSLSREEMARLIHELNVHQIELELQNEELKTSYAEIATLHDKLDAFICNIPLGYIVIDDTFVVLECNDHAEHFFPLKPNGIKHMNLGIFIRDADLNVIKNSMNTISTFNSTRTLEVRYCKADAKKYYWLRFIISALSRSAPFTFLVFIEDVTAKKNFEFELISANNILQQHNTRQQELEKKLRKVNDELDNRVRMRTAELEVAYKRLLEIDKAKNNFINVLSHELRTPLTSILGFAKLVKRSIVKHVDEIHENNDQCDWLRVNNNIDVILSESERMSALINDTLDLSKISSEHSAFKDEVVDLHALVHRLEQSTRVWLKESGNVDLQFIIPDKYETLIFNTEKLYQLFLNLLSNAIKFTSDGKIQFKVSISKNALTVEVEDTGTGIDESDLPFVFDTFYQPENTKNNTHVKGSGLGLSICKAIVAYYRGALTVDSTLGKGSKFTASLPLRKDEEVVDEPRFD